MSSPWLVCLLACILAASYSSVAASSCTSWTSKVEGCQAFVCVEGAWHPFHFDAVEHCCDENQEPPCDDACKAAANVAPPAVATPFHKPETMSLREYLKMLRRSKRH